MISRPLRWAAQGAAVAVVAVGALTMAQYDKAVSLSLDGDTSSVHVFGSTVGDLLAKQDVPVGEHDIVQPAADAPLNDGDTVVIRYGRKLTVTMDGKTSDYWTTATSVDAALAELGIRADTAKLSVSRSEPLGRSGLALTITTPKNVTVNVDGGSKTVASTGPTVADALQQLEVTLGAQDRVNPAPETPLTEGLAVTINRVEKKSVSETQAVAFGVTNQDDATLAKGTKKTTTKGVAGEQSVTFDEVWVDGKLESRTQTGAQVTKNPVGQVVAVGTKAATPPPTPPATPARDGGGAAAVCRQHVGRGPQPRQRGDVGQDRPVRVRRQLAHQHRQRLLRRAAVRAEHVARERRCRLRRARRPGLPGAADHGRQPALRQVRPPTLGLQALTERLQHVEKLGDDRLPGVSGRCAGP